MLVEKELFENVEFQKELLSGKLGPCVEAKDWSYQCFVISDKNTNTKVEIGLFEDLYNGLPYINIITDKDLNGFYFNYAYELKEASNVFKFISKVLDGLDKLKKTLLVKGKN